MEKRTAGSFKVEKCSSIRSVCGFDPELLGMTCQIIQFLWHVTPKFSFAFSPHQTKKKASYYSVSLYDTVLYCN